MSLATQNTLCQPGTSFLGKIRSAAIRQAMAIMAENATTSNHQTRLTLADRIMLDTSNAFAMALALVAASDDVTDDSVADSAIKARVAAVWDVTAGLVTSQTITLTTSDSPAGTLAM